LLQRLPEHVDADFLVGVRDCVHEHANTPHPLRVLCVGWERPRHGRSADKRYELAPFQLTELHPLLLSRVTA
jgi:hypothetical protein